MYTNSFDPNNGNILISTDRGTTWGIFISLFSYDTQLLSDGLLLLYRSKLEVTCLDEVSA